MRSANLTTLVLAFFLLAAGCRPHNTSQSASSGSAEARALMQPGHELWKQQSPDVFKVEFVTSRGDFMVQFHRNWARLGVDRVYNLVRSGFFDDSRFFRVIENFIVQFGIPGDPAVSAVWKARTIPDDPVNHSNVRGTIAYAMTGPNTRTTQLYISLTDNSRLDESGFAPLGQVIEGMEVVDKLYFGYGEDAGGGMRRGKQQKMFEGGNAHLDGEFPRLDRIIRARLVN